MYGHPAAMPPMKVYAIPLENVQAELHYQNKYRGHIRTMIQRRGVSFVRAGCLAFSRRVFN